MRPLILMWSTATPRSLYFRRGHMCCWWCELLQEVVCCLSNEKAQRRISAYSFMGFPRIYFSHILSLTKDITTGHILSLTSHISLAWLSHILGLIHASRSFHQKEVQSASRSRSATSKTWGVLDKEEWSLRHATHANGSCCKKSMRTGKQTGTQGSRRLKWNGISAHSELKRVESTVLKGIIVWSSTRRRHEDPIQGIKWRATSNKRTVSE